MRNAGVRYAVPARQRTISLIPKSPGDPKPLLERSIGIYYHHYARFELISPVPGVPPVRTCSLLIGAALAAGVVVVSQPANAASPAIQITKIYYDSPGSPDFGANSSLNGEYVQIKNTTRKAVSLKGWTLRDKTSRADHVYTFGAFTLGTGKTVTVRTGKGRNTTTTRYWGRRGGTLAYIWNQDKDTAYLRNASATLVDSCSYNSTRVDYKIC